MVSTRLLLALCALAIAMRRPTSHALMNTTREAVEARDMQRLAWKKAHKMNRTRPGHLPPGGMQRTKVPPTVQVELPQLQPQPQQQRPPPPPPPIPAPNVSTPHQQPPPPPVPASAWWQSILHGNMPSVLGKSASTPSLSPPQQQQKQQQQQRQPQQKPQPEKPEEPLAANPTRPPPSAAPSYPPVPYVQSRCTDPVEDAEHHIPVFWINLETSVERRQYFAAQMQRMGLRHKRIVGITPRSVLTAEVKVDLVPRVEHTPKEISCVISHLLAIREAIYDTTIGPKNPFALIMEDDVSFEMRVNFRQLAASVPEPFAGLQLMSSADNEMKRLWQNYKKNPVPSNLWEQRKLESFFWSAQAYMINKTAMRPLIDEVFTVRDAAKVGTGAGGEYDHLRVRIISPPKAFPCHRKGGKCDFPMRLVSDTYIYAMLFPTFVTKVPIFNGADVGGNTTIHMRKNNDVAHAKAFHEIAKLLAEARTRLDILPPHIQPKRCDVAAKPSK